MDYRPQAYSTGQVAEESPPAQEEEKKEEEKPKFDRKSTLTFKARKVNTTVLTRMEGR